MDKGFFIVITKTRPKRGETESFWKAETSEPLRGWESTTADSIEETIRLQKEQYLAIRQAGGLLPELTGSRDGPMPSGKMTRFVQIM